MNIKAIYLRNFRLYEEKVAEFEPGLNTIRGPNGFGKTSLIEAIHFLITGRSFRTAQSGEMIRHDTSHFILDLAFVKHGIDQQLRVYYSPVERRVIHNATVYPHLNNLLGLLQGVILHPGDDALIKGGPGVRRQLLDTYLCQSDPVYVHHLTRYDRAMRQRNQLLKARSEVTIDSWEYEMSNSGAYLVKRRSAAALALRGHVKRLYQLLSGTSVEMGIDFKASGLGEVLKSEDQNLLNQLREELRDQMKRHRRKEMDLGFTLTGPHKDDLLITLDGREARSYGSEGQQRTCVAALRLAQWEELYRETGEKPLMLIDDFGLSLDASRRQNFIDYVASLGQTFITDCS